MIELLAWLLAGHLVGDFLLQTRWMAENKTVTWPPLIAHSALYTAAVTCFALIGGVFSVWLVAALFFSHLFLDKRGFVLWWCRNITKSAGTPWLIVAADQGWHVVVLAACCFLV